MIGKWTLLAASASEPGGGGAGGTRDRTCLVCGHEVFVSAQVLWPELVEAWELSPSEAAYVDVQQGTRCERCGANVRSQALARALLQWAEGQPTFENWVREPKARALRILEVNEAGTLTPWMAQLPGRLLASYPDCDMTALPYVDGSFDLVVHSDTLEHVAEPLKALRECRRVLAAEGACIFTVPVIVGRLTRSRQGLPPSYHGHAGCREPDFMVHTEFGADVWGSVLDAGFASCQMVPFRYPAGVALIARR